uniref:Uncharacterized protein n=1 Tax=Rhizophora mucronata TaxID=61149 RepID=A0A2P2PIR7_RHIMU
MLLLQSNADGKLEAIVFCNGSSNEGCKSAENVSLNHDFKS